jgi:chemotaxis protein CheX
VKAASATLAVSTHQHWLPLLEVGAREVFEVMLGCHLTAAGPSTGESLNITAMVGLAGKLCGVMNIHCSGKSAAIMASKMLGLDPDKVGSELADAMGEICNMVAGNFKNKIAGLSDGCMLSVPTVIMGSDYNLHSPADSETLELKLLFENMPLVISLAIHA